MDVQLNLISVPGAQVTAWSQASLSQGSRVSTMVAQRVVDHRLGAFVIAGQNPDLSDFDSSQSVRVKDADRVLAQILQQLSSTVSGILVVDDDLARRGDPGLAGVGFVDERVLRWRDLASDPAGLTHLVRVGASGYPLNAFVCGSPTSPTIPPPGGPLSDMDVERLVNDVRIVIHSVFDAESFAFLPMDEDAQIAMQAMIL